VAIEECTRTRKARRRRMRVGLYSFVIQKSKPKKYCLTRGSAMKRRGYYFSSFGFRLTHIYFNSTDHPSRDNRCSKNQPVPLLTLKLSRVYPRTRGGQGGREGRETYGTPAPSVIVEIFRVGLTSFDSGLSMKRRGRFFSFFWLVAAD
jgi:hypothetical protein